LGGNLLSQKTNKVPKTKKEDQKKLKPRLNGNSIRKTKGDSDKKGKM
jgi:hypothetical protein